jgi:hypothetical protein
MGRSSQQFHTRGARAARTARRVSPGTFYIPVTHAHHSYKIVGELSIGITGVHRGHDLELNETQGLSPSVEVRLILALQLLTLW